MATAALIKDGVVVDVIVAEAAFLLAAPVAWKNLYDQILPLGGTTSPPFPVAPGYTWTAGISFNPPPDAVISG